MKKPSPFVVKYLPILMLVSGIFMILRGFIIEPTIIDVVNIGFTPKGIDNLIGMIMGVGLLYYSFYLRKKYQDKD